MKKGIVCALLTAGILFCAGTSFAVTTHAYYPEISMEAPASLSVIKNNYTDAFPPVSLSDFKTMYVLVLLNKFPDSASMQDSLVQLSGVPMTTWTLADSSEADSRGWTWRKEYQALGNNNTVAYAILGQGALGSYIVMYFTSQSDITAYADDFQTWKNTISVMSLAQPAAPGVPLPPMF